MPYAISVLNGDTGKIHHKSGLFFLMNRMLRKEKIFFLVYNYQCFEKVTVLEMHLINSSLKELRVNLPK